MSQEISIMINFREDVVPRLIEGGSIGHSQYKKFQLQRLKVRAIVPFWNMQITFYYLTFVYGSDYTNKLINVYTIQPFTSCWLLNVKIKKRLLLKKVRSNTVYTFTHIEKYWFYCKKSTLLYSELLWPQNKYTDFAV